MAFKSKVLLLTTSDQDLHQCGAGLENSIHGLVFGNLTGADQTATLKLYKQVTGASVPLGTVLVKANDTYPWPKAINLEPGDKVIVVAAAANAVVAEASIFEQGGSAPITTGITPKGAFSSTTTYVTNDLVNYTDGNSYLSLQNNNLGKTPSSNPSWWMVFAAKGATGANTASAIALTPTGDVAATDLQAAIAELAAEKATVSSVAAKHDTSAVAAASDIWTGTNTDKRITAKGLMDSMDIIDDGTGSGTWTPNIANGPDRKRILNGNSTLAVPLGMKRGARGLLFPQQDATGGRTLSYAAGWKFNGGVKDLDPSPNAVGMISYIVVDPTAPLIYASLQKGFV